MCVSVAALCLATENGVGIAATVIFAVVGVANVGIAFMAGDDDASGGYGGYGGSGGNYADMPSDGGPSISGMSASRFCCVTAVCRPNQRAEAASQPGRDERLWRHVYGALVVLHAVCDLRAACWCSHNEQARLALRVQRSVLAIHNCATCASGLNA